MGVAGESNQIRIGTQNTQTGAYVAGIYGSTLSGTTQVVVVNSNGQLGSSTGSSINTNVLSNSAQCNLSVGDNTNNVNAVGVTGVTALGEGALQNNTGSYNTAVGCQALNANTVGNNNVAVGYQALQNNPSGTNDIAIGYQSMLNAIGSNDNIALGTFSAQSLLNTDQLNIAIGKRAMQLCKWRKL